MHPSEEGHADFAPCSALEFELAGYLQNRYRLDRISVERVVSGQGILSIYQFLRDQQTMAESPELAQAVQNWSSRQDDRK